MISRRRGNGKIALTGDATVGKTSLRRTFRGRSFKVNYIRTLGCDFSFKELELDGERYGFIIWDLAGHIHYQSVHPQYYRGAQAAMVVYDVTNLESFKSVENWVDRYVSATRMRGAPIIVIGNKTDLIEKIDGRSVSEAEQELLIQKLRDKYQNAFPILSGRTSALDDTNVNECFHAIGTAIVDQARKRATEAFSDRGEALTVDVLYPAAYVFAFNEVEGPTIVGSSPEKKHRMDHDPQAITSTMKAMTSIDFADVSKHRQVLGSQPWMSPNGTLHYIAFTRPNKKARGGEELFLIGVVGQRLPTGVSPAFQEIINGYLHTAMNEFGGLVQATRADFITVAPDDALLGRFQSEITALLRELRQNCMAAVES